MLVASCAPAPALPAPTATATPLENQYAEALACIEGDNEAIAETAQVVVVIGHAYGNHQDSNVGLYPPAIEALSTLSEYSHNLVLTGDITRDGLASSLQQAKSEVEAWQVMAVPGNHDVVDRPAFTRQFNEPYGSRWIDETLLVWLDTDLDDWRISGQQLDWFTSLIATQAQGAQELVVFTHHLIWSVGDGTDFPINGGRRGDGTHDPGQLSRLLAGVPGEVAVVSGDVGAFPDRSPLACVVRDGVKYVASGVGGGVADNLLLMSVGDGIQFRACTLDLVAACADEVISR